MFKFRYLLLFIFSISFCLFSCKTQEESVLDELEEFLLSAESSYETFSDSQWEEIESQYEEISVKADSLVSDMSEEQKKKLNNLKGRYVALQLKHLGKELGDGLKDFQQQVEGLLEGIGLDSLAEHSQGNRSNN